MIDGRRGSSIALAIAAALLVLPLPRVARAFGEQGGFDPRVLLTGTQTTAARASAPARWAWELVQRTSAPAHLRPSTVHADETSITDAPFAYWSGDTAPPSLSAAEIAGLRRFFALGGVLFVDDAAAGENGEPSAFGRGARKEVERVIPDAAPIAIGPEHVIFRTFYLLRRAEGRVPGTKTLDAIVRGGAAQVIFAENDLGGALAKSPTGDWEHPVTPNGDAQREHAIRLAVNIAMYIMCSNYKDDQVHAPFLMRRRAASTEP